MGMHCTRVYAGHIDDCLPRLQLRSSPETSIYRNQVSLRSLLCEMNCRRKRLIRLHESRLSVKPVWQCSQQRTRREEVEASQRTSKLNKGEQVRQPLLQKPVDYSELPGVSPSFLADLKNERPGELTRLLNNSGSLGMSETISNRDKKDQERKPGLISAKMLLTRQRTERLSSDERERQEKAEGWAQNLVLMSVDQTEVTEFMAIGNLLLENRHWLWSLVFDILAKERKWELALLVLRNMQEQRWYTPHPRWQTKVISILGIVEQPEEAEKVFRKMDCKPNTQAYNALLKAFLQSGCLKKANILFEKMKLSSCGKPNQKSYHILIDFCLKTMNIEWAELLFEELQMKGWAPDLLTYNAMIMLYARNGPWEKMEGVTAQLFAAGLLPNAATWDALIGGFLTSGKVSEIRNITRSSQASGHKLSEVNMKRLMNHLIKSGHIASAEEILKNLLRQQVKLGLVTYNSIVSGYAHRGAYGKMESVLQTMNAAGCAPDLLTLTSCVHGYLKAKQLTKAEQTLQAMQARGFKPDLVLFADVVGAAGTSERVLAIEQFVDRVGKEEGQLEEEIYKAAIGALRATKRVERAGLVWGKALGDQEEEWPEEVMWASVITGELQWELWEELESFLDRLSIAGLETGCPFFNIMIIGYVKIRRPRRVLSILGAMKRRNLPIDLVAFNTLVSYLGRMRQVRAAEKLMEVMQMQGYKPDVYTYNSILDAYKNAGFLGEMEAMFEKMKEAGCQPDTVTYATVMNAYGRQGILQKLKSVYAMSLEANCPPNMYALQALSLGSREYNRKMRKLRSNNKRWIRLEAAAAAEEVGKKS